MDAESPAALTFPQSLLRLPSFVLFQLTRQTRRLAHELGDEGLRLPHLTILSCVAEFGPMSQKEISARLCIDASDLVALVDDLERGGLATRSRDERDRRRYAIALTEAGRAALRRRLAMSGKLDELLLAPLSAAERTQLHRLLLRVYAHHDPDRLPPEYR